jgi:biopolymer transport protein ExbB
MLEILVTGGPLMIGLVAFSVIALGVLIDRGVAFWQYRSVDNRGLRAKVIDLMEQDRIEEAAQICASTPGPVSAVLLAGLQSYHRHRHLADKPGELAATIEKAMADYAQHAVHAVATRLSILATVGNAAPLLGMAGTVLGMVGAFGTIEKLQGLDAAAVGGDIAEALITTLAGLLIALGAVIF